MDDGNAYNGFALLHLIAGNGLASKSPHGAAVVEACAKRSGRQWRPESAYYYADLWRRRPAEAERIFTELGGKRYGFDLSTGQLTLASLAASLLVLPLAVDSPHGRSDRHADHRRRQG